MKPLFLITSALNPSYGVFSLFDRHNQTKNTIKSIREKVPEASIFLVDVSVNGLPPHIQSDIINSVDYFMSLNNHPGMMQLSNSGPGAKSPSEALMTLLFLETVKERGLDKEHDRIFKITGRLELDDGFDINAYENLHGKYVFKKRVPTWMPTPYKKATHLFDTRLHSYCSSLVDYHIGALKNMFDYFQHVDLEHAMFATIDIDKVVEFERVFCKGMVASSGEWRYD